MIFRVNTRRFRSALTLAPVHGTVQDQGIARFPSLHLRLVGLCSRRRIQLSVAPPVRGCPKDLVPMDRGDPRPIWVGTIIQRHPGCVWSPCLALVHPIHRPGVSPLRSHETRLVGGGTYPVNRGLERLRDLAHLSWPARKSGNSSRVFVGPVKADAVCAGAARCLGRFCAWTLS
jgi:hypothetical protein